MMSSSVIAHTTPHSRWKFAMLWLTRTLGAGTLLLVLGAGSATAQIYNLAAGYGVGFFRPGELNPGVSGTRIGMDSGWILTGFGEGWYSAAPHFGARLNAAYSNRPMQLGDDPRDINTWMADVSILFRPLAPDVGTIVAPFLSVGGGFVHYGLGRGSQLFFPEQGVSYSGNDQWRGALVGGVGVDIVLDGFTIAGTPLGVRLEVADHVVLRSPFRGLDDDRGLGPIHNLRAGISLVGFGWF